MRNVYCLGELLIDFICKDVGVNLAEGTHFEKNAGGAPANVAAAIAKLGGKAFFMGKVGHDSFGVFLEKTLQEVNVDTSMMCKGNHTTLAFVSIDADGERDFTFLRGADGEYSFDNIDFSRMQTSDIHHFGSATAWLPGTLKQTYDKMLLHAKEQGNFISFDPNYRDALITKKEEFRQDCINFLLHADFVKVSKEEACLIADTHDVEEAITTILQFGTKILCVTLGDQGTFLATAERREIIPSIKIKQVDSTGAGDAFVGAMMFQFSKEEDLLGIHQDFERLSKYVRFANRVGAITCTNYGAISAMNFEQMV